jgi:hypothetical protein
MQAPPVDADLRRVLAAAASARDVRSRVTEALQLSRGSISVVAGARNHLRANRSLEFRFEILA